jgi:hypothetical protein
LGILILKPSKPEINPPLGFSIPMHKFKKESENNPSSEYGIVWRCDERRLLFNRIH